MVKKYCSRCGLELPDDVETSYNCLVCGPTTITETPPIPKQRKRDILTLGSERGTPVWAGIIISFNAILCLFLGYAFNIVGFYFVSVFLIFAVVIGVLRNILGQYEKVWKAAAKILYIVGIAAGGVYLGFVNVKFLYLNLGVLAVLGGISYFTKRGKWIREYTILADKYLTLYAIVVTILILLFTQLL